MCIQLCGQVHIHTPVYVLGGRMASDSLALSLSALFLLDSISPWIWTWLVSSKPQWSTVSHSEASCGFYSPKFKLICLFSKSSYPPSRLPSTCTKVGYILFSETSKYQDYSVCHHTHLHMKFFTLFVCLSAGRTHTCHNSHVEIRNKLGVDSPSTIWVLGNQM